jgi:transketolase
MSRPDFTRIRRFSADIRIETIKALAHAGFGHIGGSMSIVDALSVLYGCIMNIRPKEPDWPDRDWLILSKGHCGPALYATLALKGYFPLDWLKTINVIGTNLPSHCDMLKTPGIDMTTGSLGQGISAAAGIALGNRIQGRNNFTYCIIGDGELNEGQVWEALQAAAHNKLDHLIILVDYNKKQLDGRLEQICNPLDIGKKLSSFGCNVYKAKGYEVEEIYDAIIDARKTEGKPSAIILDTFKGIGCSFAEKAEFNHYMEINDVMAKEAIDEIERRLKENCYPRGDLL